MKKIIIYFAFCTFSLLITSSANSNTIQEIEKKIGTNGSTDRNFHALAVNTTFQYDGFFIGIEKTKREIALNNKELPNVSIDSLKVLNVLPSKTKILKKSIGKRLYHDEEVTFVSHIIDTESFSQKKYVYNLYENLTANSVLDISEDNIYRDGWEALEILRIKLIERIKKAEQTKKKYTHLILMSTGWNTTQVESIVAYNDWSSAIIQNAPKSAEFRPLFITLSWPSVWFYRETTIPFSVKRKGNDADEIGLLAANMLVNNIMLDKELKDLKKVLIGHSFGARLLSRALFSKGLIQPSVNIEGEIDTFIGLQSAFSFKRFSPEKADAPLLKKENGEGFPYRRWPNMKTKLFFTMSSEDEAGGFLAKIAARFLPRDKYMILGENSWEKANKLSTKKKKEDRVDNIKFITVDDLECDSFTPSITSLQGGDIVYVDASKCITSHNDVYELRHGKLLNSFISY